MTRKIVKYYIVSSHSNKINCNEREIQIKKENFIANINITDKSGPCIYDVVYKVSAIWLSIYHTLHELIIMCQQFTNQNVYLIFLEPFSRDKIYHMINFEFLSNWNVFSIYPSIIYNVNVEVAKASYISITSRQWAISFYH